MSGTLVPPTAPRPETPKPNPDRIQCPHNYSFIKHCPVCTPQPGVSATKAQRLAKDMMRRNK